MKGKNDAMEDKKMFHKMLKKAVPGKKITKHLKKDIKEGQHAIKEDIGLMKSMNGGCK